MFICSDRCRISCLPFQKLTNKVFLDTTFGKQKFPCKKCSRSCSKRTKSIKCNTCGRWQHTLCALDLDSKSPVPNLDSDSFFCSDACVTRSLPFSKLDDFDLNIEVPSANSFSITQTSTGELVSIQTKSDVETIVKSIGGNNSIDVVDPFSHVYCDYLSVNDLPFAVNEEDPNNFSIFHSNVISLKKNLHLVEDIFNDCLNLPSVIAISETGLKSNIDKSSVSLEGYEFERVDSKYEKGGVGLYIENELDYEVRDDLRLKVNSAEDLWVEIKSQKRTSQPQAENDSLIIGVIYRHPNTPYRPFLSRLCHLTEKLNRDKKQFMIVGDININYLKYNLTRKITEYVNALKSSGCNFHCNLPTRIYKNSISSIDHVYSNFEQHHVETSVILSDVSDHFSTLTRISNARNFSKKQKDIYKRKFKISEKEEINLINDLKNFFDSPPIQRLQKCPNVMAKIIVQAYQNIINKYFPLKKLPKRVLKFISKPWFTRGIKVSIRNKNKLHAKLKKRYTEDGEIYFKRYRNILTKLKFKAFNKYYSDKAALAQKNISKSWAIVNEIAKRKKRQHTKISSLYDNNGREVSDETEISNLLNHHFSTIGNNMADKVPETATDPLSYVKYDKTGSFFLSPTTLEEVLKLIESLDTKKAAGSDGIPCFLIKKTKCIIAPVLCSLFNVFINESVFPDIFKVAEVKPLFKGGDRRVKGNYRPISLLPLFSKLFEKIIAKRMTTYFEKNEIMTNHQFGFRKSYSTELAAINLYDTLLKNLDEKKITCTIFLDLAKAFDSVNHKILLQKLEKYGVRGYPLKLLESYLSNRKQYVKLNDKFSKLEIIDIGIPQGSILGPLLFLIYINDLPNASNFFVKLFADDTFLSLSCNTFKELKKKTNSEIKKIYAWLVANKLTLNIKKSKFMIISKRKGGDPNLLLKD